MWVEPLVGSYMARCWLPIAHSCDLGVWSLCGLGVWLCVLKQFSFHFQAFTQTLESWSLKQSTSCGWAAFPLFTTKLCEVLTADEVTGYKDMAASVRTLMQWWVPRPPCYRQESIIHWPTFMFVTSHNVTSWLRLLCVNLASGCMYLAWYTCKYVHAHCTMCTCTCITCIVHALLKLLEDNLLFNTVEYCE